MIPDAKGVRYLKNVKDILTKRTPSRQEKPWKKLIMIFLLSFHLL